MSLAPTTIPVRDSGGNPHDRLMMEDAASKLSAVMVEHPEQRAALIAALETREDGQDATQGAKADAPWDGTAGPASVVSILKAIWGKVAGTLTVTGPLTNTQLRAAEIPVTDAAIGARDDVAWDGVPAPVGIIAVLKGMFSRLSATAPARRAVAVVPHDANALTEIPKALYVGTGGTIVMRGVDGTVDQIWRSVAPGAILPFQAQYVRATGTTAADILALY